MQEACTSSCPGPDAETEAPVTIPMPIKALSTKNPMPKPLPAPHPPSGDQHVIGYGHQQAVVTEVGGGLRSYTVGDDGVLDGFEASEMCGGGRGQVLAPWPNRLGDGLYSFDDIQGHAALDEPDRRNAIH